MKKAAPLKKPRPVVTSHSRDVADLSVRLIKVVKDVTILIMAAAITAAIAPGSR